jgi:hypothetical protein
MKVTYVIFLHRYGVIRTVLFVIPLGLNYSISLS